MARSSLGQTHETTIRCMVNLAGTYKELGTDEGMARAVTLLEQALESV
jgi:hypothetical protein